jgi:hypothetical protein
VEKVFLIGLAAGILLTMMTIDSKLAIVSLVGLAVTFFLYAFRPVDVPLDENIQLGMSELLSLMILPKVMWISSAVSTLGIVFYLAGTDNYQKLLMIGVSTLAIAVLLQTLLIVGGSKYRSVGTPALWRCIPLLLTNTYLLLQ